MALQHKTSQVNRKPQRKRETEDQNLTLGGSFQPLELLLQLLRAVVGLSLGFGETLHGGLLLLNCISPRLQFLLLASESTLKFGHLLPILGKLTVSNL